VSQTGIRKQARYQAGVHNKKPAIRRPLGVYLASKQNQQLFGWFTDPKQYLAGSQLKRFHLTGQPFQVLVGKVRKNRNCQ
jgi:hypothetical protein